MKNDNAICSSCMWGSEFAAYLADPNSTLICLCPFRWLQPCNCPLRGDA